MGDQVLIRDNQTNKYEAPYKGPYTIIQTCTNVKAMISMGTTMDRINIRCLNYNIHKSFHDSESFLLFSFFMAVVRTTDMINSIATSQEVVKG